jgi:glutamate synthase (NADPH) large chain
MARESLYEPFFEHDACGFGFVCDVRGHPSNGIVRDALTVLVNLEHRGATGAEPDTGDGAGLLVQVPHDFLAKEATALGFDLPAARRYAVGMVFLPHDANARDSIVALVEGQLCEAGLPVLGWRDVPTDDRTLGPTARVSQPAVRQVFVARPEGVEDDLAFERRLYVGRRLAEKAVARSTIRRRGDFYLPSLSARTVVYKGMLNASQLGAYYPDLGDPTLVSAIAMVHSRFSTNTFPSWSRAHPYRFISHNGEINTLRGNVNWMRAREATLRSALFGADLARILPVIDSDGSDSAMFDNVLELLHLAGRSLPHAVMMMIPEPWSRHASMAQEKRDFFAYHAALMEPWDGPASIAFTDGTVVGATLDRNGLRPARYWVTADGRVVMASEAGVLDIPPGEVVAKGRLEPGRMFLVDTAAGRIVPDDELKRALAGEAPYGEWIGRSMIHLPDLPDPGTAIEPDHDTVMRRQETFGYTTEEVRLIIGPMAVDAAEPVGSMGNDAPLAVLSDQPQLLPAYFTQLFAQVTNPPLDAIREEIVTAVETVIGPEANLLEPGPGAARQLSLPSPVLRNEELEQLRHLDGSEAARGFRSVTLPILYRVGEGGPGLRRAIESLREHASAAIAEGSDLIILSDRGHDEEDAPIPALLAVAAVHHHLLRAGTRTRVGLVLESGEPREVHHFALLIGYGASAINPYLALETIHDQIRAGMIGGPADAAERRYLKAVTKGVVKVASKMGISAISAYHGAQVFEALGLSQDFIDEYFTGTPSRIGGIGIDLVADEVRRRHDRAYPGRRRTADHPPASADHDLASADHGPGSADQGLASGGRYQYRDDGEAHLWTPQTIHALQRACRTGDYDAFKEYSRAIDDQSRRHVTLRSLLDLVPARQPVPLDEVEPVEGIVRRFKTGAMSYGSISAEAHEALAIAMNRLGGRSNTGEGGEDPGRYRSSGDGAGDSRSSAIKQVASARFGVTSEYLVSATEIQIKMAQGAKPGEGGQLPGHKVYPWIAAVRHSTPGVGLISPPPHHDIYSIEDLAELIYDLRMANPRARISVKLVSEVGVGTVAAGVAKAHADVVLISGHDGGTGASPLSSIKHAGAPWELGLAETHQVLVANDLRSRIAVEVDGQLKTGRDVVIGALLGAQEFGFATAPLVSLGCVMMRACHLNTCPVGIATQDPVLRARYTGDPEHAVTFMRFIATEVREHLAALGARSLDAVIGHPEHLAPRRGIEHAKARRLDLGRLLHEPRAARRGGQTSQDGGVEASLDARTLLPACAPAIESGRPVHLALPIRNTDRAVGTLVGSEVTRRHGAAGLPDGTIDLRFTGSAGQSFGAFLPRGITLRLAGDANDYLGKGLSGGRIVVAPPDGSPFAAEEQVIAGNVACYGATSGEVFLRGIVGERFCVRNSGATAVVEGVGEHGCEYMTGGLVLILGRTGRNFAAGMSGGIACVLDADGSFADRCNTELVGIAALDNAAEIAHVRELVERHLALTGSAVAARLIGDWAAARARFVRVVPHDYRRVLEAEARMLATGLAPDEAQLAAFDEHARHLSRVGAR